MRIKLESDLDRPYVQIATPLLIRDLSFRLQARLFGIEFLGTPLPLVELSQFR